MERLTCDVCPRTCKFAADQTGFCGVRKNVGGVNADGFYQLIDAYPVASEFFGYSASFPGCNLRCSFCGYPEYSKPTNAQLSKLRLMDENYLAFMVKACGRNGVNFFGGEPGLHFEYVIEAANQCRKRGLLTVLSTNGYLSGWVAEKLAKAVHTTTVGIKASASTEYYRVKLGADASVCLESARIFWNTGFLSQISNLIGPNLGTPEDDVKFAEWISANLDPDYPVRLIPLLDVNTALPVEPWPDVRARVTTTISRLKKGGLHHFYLPQQYDGCGWLND